MNQNSQPTEAQAVVEFASAAEFIASLNAESMLPAALNAFSQNDLISAMAVVEQFDPTKQNVDDFSTMARRLSGTRSYDHMLEVIQSGVAALNLDSDYRIGGQVGGSNRVCFSTDEDFVPSDPYLCFVALRPGSGNFVERQQEAAAVAFFPSDMITFPSKETGEIIHYPNMEALEGYTHVVAYFPSIREARQAKMRLRDALGIVRKASRLLRSAENPDPIRSVGLDAGPAKFGKRASTEMPF